MILLLVLIILAVIENILMIFDLIKINGSRYNVLNEKLDTFSKT